MRNRAKCKLCEEIIESKAQHDYVICKCGEIGVDGGEAWPRCLARDWRNFIRIDDGDNEVIPTIVDKEPEVVEEKLEKIADRLTTADHLGAINSMIEAIERLPDHEMIKPITHYDYYSMLLVVREVLRSVGHQGAQTDPRSP